MIRTFFVSDLHGRAHRYEALFRMIRGHKPRLVLFGGDLMSHGHYRHSHEDFIGGYLYGNLREMMDELGADYPKVYIILGNDDPRSEEEKLVRLSETGVWHYLHDRKDEFEGYTFYGYSNIPPSPFRFKDWERYDVSRYVDPGCTHPSEGIRTMDPGVDLEWATIKDELNSLAGDGAMERAVFLFHSPPYKTFLDRAALDGKMFDHVPLDVHVGSIAIMRLIEERQPWLTMHGHIHESSSITGFWQQKFGRTLALSAAWDGPELALVDFDLENPSTAIRHLL
jgi:Icc-related predicted phosphoesterase